MTLDELIGRLLRIREAHTDSGDWTIGVGSNFTFDDADYIEVRHYSTGTVVEVHYSE